MGLSSKLQDDSLEYWSQIGDHLDINPSLNPKLAANECKNNQQRLQSYKGPPLNCPRCDSTNTKFCYYNNYSKLQPRHFCRACKRHWTAGGTLRNVPVGGSSRKNSKRTAKTTTPKATITTSSSTVVNNINEKQQQQSVDTIFPEIFGQVMFQPDQMIMEPQMKLDTEIGIGVGSSSSSDSRLFGYKGPDESLLNLMDLGPAGYSGGEGWNAASYWNCWDGLNDGV